jgi:hypothetical protein
MSQSYFDRNQNLQIHGDVNFFAGNGSTPDNRSMFLVYDFENQQLSDKLSRLSPGEPATSGGEP